MDPASWSLAGVLQTVSAVGTVLQTVSGITQARGSAAQDKALADQAMAAARQDEFIDRRRSAQLIAKQQAGAAAAGLDIGSGSPLELKLDSAYNAELNALQIRKRGQMQSAFYKNRAAQIKAQIPGIVFQGLTQLGGDYLKYRQLQLPKTPKTGNP